MIILRLFCVFFTIGAFSFGGGLASMELIRSRVVSMEGWLTDSEFTDIISISEMTPGPLGINIASFTGVRIGGVAGAVVATIAYALPALFIVIVLVELYKRFSNMTFMKGIMKGLRPAVAAMVFASMYKLVGNAWWGKIPSASELISLINPVAVILTAVFLLLLQKKKLGPVQAILLSGVCGGIIYGFMG